MGEHWGYAKNDLKFKSPSTIIEELAECRRYGANMLLNVGPTGDGTLRSMDAAILESVGIWTGFYEEAIRTPKPTGIEIENKPQDFILQEGDTYYLFCYGLPSYIDVNVSLGAVVLYEDAFQFDKEVKDITWLDDGSAVDFEQADGKVVVHTKPFHYGKNLVVRVAKIVC